MASIRLKMNNRAFAELRNSAEVGADLNRRGRRIQSAAGDGFELREARPGTKGGAPRNRVSVGTTTFASRRRQARDNVLQRALGAGR